MGGSRSIFLTLLAVYMLLYAAFGALSPFLPALLREQGLQAEAIGIAASTAIRVVAGPVIGHAADRFQEHTAMLCMCAFAATVASVGYVTIHGLGGLLMVAISHAAMLAPIVPISDALATTAARQSESEGRRFEYGWLRASGSAAFVAGTVLSGWSAHQSGLTGVVWISGLSLFAAASWLS
jgi:PPP family 3-phenylpropionic acid transporter